MVETQNKFCISTLGVLKGDNNVGKLYTTLLWLGTNTHPFNPNKPRPLDSENEGEGWVAGSREEGIKEMAKRDQRMCEN